MSVLTQSAAAKNCRRCLGASAFSRRMLNISAAFLLCALFPALAFCSQIALNWDPSTEPNVVGYKIYYGQASREYANTIDVGLQTSFVLTPLPAGQTTYLAVTAYDDKGQESVFSMEVTWPQADQPADPPFTVSQSTGTAPLPVTFSVIAPTDSSAIYDWDFGDGTSGRGPIAEHVYSSPGTFMARLSISGLTRMVTEYSTTITVDLGAVDGRPPVAVIQPEAVFGTSTSPVRLDGAQSSDPDGGRIVAWEWQMGDGTTKSTAQITHQYRVNGVYTASLSVTNEQGLRSTVRVPVTIDTPTQWESQPPVPVITVSKKRGPAPLQVDFSAKQSQARDERQIVSYAWDFGDGASAQGTAARHTFIMEAEYKVSLRATDNFGESASTTAIIRVAALQPNLLPILQLLLLTE